MIHGGSGGHFDFDAYNFKSIQTTAKISTDSKSTFNSALE